MAECSGMCVKLWSLRTCERDVVYVQHVRLCIVCVCVRKGGCSLRLFMVVWVADNVVCVVRWRSPGTPVWVEVWWGGVGGVPNTLTPCWAGQDSHLGFDVG